MNRMFATAALAVTVIASGIAFGSATADAAEQLAALPSATKVTYLKADQAAKALKDQGYAMVVGLHYWNHAYEGRALKAGQGWTKVRVDPISGSRLSSNNFARVAALY